MLLQELLKNTTISDDINIDITGIAYDSRKVKTGDVFVCIEGYKVDGHNFVDSAIEKGANAIIAQKEIAVPEGIALIRVGNTRKVLAEIASKFYGEPSKKLNLIGVTGTKGKTTTTFMIKKILEAAGHKVGLLGTIANYVGEKVMDADRTTPESLEIQMMFADMLEQGIDTVIMEVSSHSLDLYRVHACEFDLGIFTNLSRDHLDFHKDFENYFSAKAKLFNICKSAAINVDDEYGKRLVITCKCPYKSYGIRNQADLKAEKVVIKEEGTKFEIELNGERLQVEVPIPGTFSVYNAMAAISACISFNVDGRTIVEALKNIKVPGRAEIVETKDNYTVMVDYAHSPDSLENILNAVKMYAPGRVVSIFGCGGDRDKTKRPIMGEISGRLADFTVITSDNPRTEDPETIVAEVEEGIKGTKAEYIVQSDRYKAIQYAIENAKEKDIILIAGKGHETYQIFKEDTIHFDDREVAREIIDKVGVRFKKISN